MIASGTRDVTIRYHAVADPSIKRTLDAIASQTERVESGKQRAAKASAKVSADGAREEAKAQREYVQHETRRIRALEQRARAEQRAATQTARAESMVARQRAQDAKELERSLNSQWKLHQRAQDQQARAAREAAVAQSVAASKATTAQNRMTKALFASGSAALDLARSVAMLGVMGEKDTEKLLRALIGIQVGFDAFRSAAGLIKLLRGAWVAYTTAVNAAAAAHVALAAAQSLGGKAAVGGAAASAAKAALGSAAGRAVGSTLAGKAIGGAAAAGSAAVVIAPLAAIAAALTGVLVGGIAVVSKDFRSGLVELFNRMRGRGTGARLERENAAVARDFISADERVSEQLRAQDALRRQSLDLFGGDAKQELNAARRARQSAYRPMSIYDDMAGVEAGRQLASQREADAITRIKALREDQLKTAVEERKQRISGALEELNTARSLLDTRREELKATRGALSTAKQRYGDLSPAEQAEARRVAAKAATSGPESLSRYERGILGGIGLTDATRLAQRGSELAAERGGWSSLMRDVGHTDRLNVAAGERRIQELTSKLNAGITIDHEVNVKLGLDDDAMVREFQRKLSEKMKPEMEKLRRDFEEAIKRVYLSGQRHAAAQERAARGTGP